MELRSCSHLHFIRTVKAGLEIKIPNVVRGRPALKFKPVKDLYDYGVSSSHGLLPEKVEVEDLPFDCYSFQIESKFIPVAESTIRVEPGTSQCNFSPGDGVKVDLDDLVTLKQIKETCKAKKRKRYTFVSLGKETIENCSILKEEHPYSQPQDECDLLEPLSLWKSRLSKKRKSKRKVMSKNVSTAFENDLSAVKSEQIPIDQDFFHSEDDLPVPINIKVEFPVHDYTDCQNAIHEIQESSFSFNNDGCGSMVVSDKEPGMATDCVFDAGALDFCTTEPLCCLSDASCYNYMEFADSHSYLDVITLGREIIMVDDPQMTDYQLSDMPLLEYKEQNQNISPLQLDDPCESVIPLQDYKEPCCFISPLQHNDPCRTIISSEGHTSEELVPSMEVENFCHSVVQHPPENLLSARKVISPTSQEKLCLAMESSEPDDLEYYRYMGKLCYRKKSENKSSGVKGPNQARRAEVVDQTVKKQKNKRKMFNSRANQKAHPSRDVPPISTGCPTIESLSENAILFSQQQMSDFEYIATKLAQELKSMRDIVEAASQSGVYPAASLKYNTEEVRIAIKNATRTEETTRRWLSVTARNCSRFCKIMKLTEKHSDTSEIVVHKVRKKIVFADEAGGKLCHVKVFDNSTPSLAV
ncbi:hypothetical protein HS088_TW12G00598 [Tripterygium wilfordii]|uniref:Uncharacterized protein n=2 Tax=Tripterygium wilfordii TaxID=458696 RepID=A0A7J7CZ98_TRIWF|nr:hypothetical protein HS088_TW12G00598 [Tripterygium wilfordii]